MKPKFDLEELSKVWRVGPFEVSADGKKVACMWDREGFWEIFTLELTDDGVSEPKKVSPGPGTKLYPEWNPVEDKVTYMKDNNGDEKYEIYQVPAKGGEVVNLTNRPDILKQAMSWSPDGKKIAIEGNFDGKFALWMLTLETGECEKLVYHPLGRWMDPRFSPDGKWIAFAGNRTKKPRNQDLYVIPSTGGADEKLVSLSDDSEEAITFRWSPDSKEIAFVTNFFGSEDIGIASLEDKSITWIAKNRWEKSSPVFSPDGKRLSYTINVKGNFDICITEISGMKTEKLDLPKGVNYNQRFSRDGESMVFLHSGPRSPGDLWEISLETGEKRQLTHSLRGVIDPEHLVEPEVITYRSFDGVEISAFLYLPKGMKKGLLPVILWIHGGPTAQWVNSWKPGVQFFVSSGFAVLAPNYRGSTGYGKKFRDLNLKDWGGGDLKDVVAGVEYLEKHGISHRSKIGITGTSYGGYTTWMALTKAPKYFSAGVPICGMTNLVTDFNTTREDLRLYSIQQLGHPDDNSQLYYDRSPVNFAQNIRAPVFIIHGARDPNVTMGNTDEIEPLLKKYNKPYEKKVYPDEGHGLMKLKNRIDALKLTLDFFQRHLAS